ncbi:CD209 antigen-like protein E [Heptranchias perlo]|uniref:CD209 antigen-like protein E n=1 Tax=Heptranchias perlo TaxID=212740 RepID=UPI003559370C
MEADITYAELKFSQSSLKQQLPAPSPSNADTKKPASWKVPAIVLLVICFVLIAAIVSQITAGYLTRKELETTFTTLEKLNHNFTHLQEKYTQLWMRFCDQNRAPECDEIFCPKEWKFFNGSCYFFSTERRNWTESAKYCSGNKSHLVVITSQEEQDFVKGGYYAHWIGLTDEEKEGTWQWVDGAGPLSEPEFWRRGEPNNHKSAHCEDENCATTDYWGWNDDCCVTRWKWICERKSTALVQR